MLSPKDHALLNIANRADSIRKSADCAFVLAPHSLNAAGIHVQAVVRDLAELERMATSLRTLIAAEAALAEAQARNAEYVAGDADQFAHQEPV